MTNNNKTKDKHANQSSTSSRNNKTSIVLDVFLFR